MLLLTVLLVSLIAVPAYAYLVPVIAGLGWLVALIAGGILAVATFIWLHIIKYHKPKDGNNAPKD